MQLSEHDAHGGNLSQGRRHMLALLQGGLRAHYDRKTTSIKPSPAITFLGTYLPRQLSCSALGEFDKWAGA